MKTSAGSPTTAARTAGRHVDFWREYLKTLEFKRMFSVARDFSFSYGHRLYRYEGKCRRLHGHNAEVRVEILVDSLNEQGMALDFVDLKAIVGTWIDETLDHRVFLAKDDPLAETLVAAGEPVFLFDENPTAERLAKMIYEYVEAQGFVVGQVEFWETKNCRATYRKSASMGK